MKKCWCGNAELIPYSEHYSRCQICHTLVSNEEIDDSVTVVQNEDSDLYGSNYWKEQMAQMAGEVSLDAVIDRYLGGRALYWLKTMLKYKLPGVKSVELGCGLGQFSYLMEETGYQQTATELSAEICQFIRDTLQINVIQGSIDQVEGKIDVIEAFDVIEHVTEPIGFVQQIASRLEEDGILCLQTPCYDEELDYGEMEVYKPRFKDQMKKNEHVFLFSKKSMVRLLGECGFPYCRFEPAFFGDDYDMYLFASRKPIEVYSEKEIDTALNRQENGRLIKALLRVFNEKRKAEEFGAARQTDADERLKQIEQLNQWLQESETDRAARLEQLNSLEQRLAESEADRRARSVSIEKLEGLLKESESDREARLIQVQELGERLAESEADRQTRLVRMEELDRRLAQSDADRAARLEQLNSLEQRLAESEADRRARSVSIEKLEGLLKESESDREARLIQVQELGERLAESEADRQTRLVRIEELERRLAQSDTDREARLAQVQELEKQLMESEADRRARLVSIEKLEGLLKESEADREARLMRMQELEEQLIRMTERNTDA